MTQEKALAILKAGRNVFLTGSAGSGKTYVLNQYIKYLKDRKVGVAVTASTGIAATHMNGQTIHSWSGMGIKDSVTTSDLLKMQEKKYLREHIEFADVLIIDEISMLHKKQIQMLNDILMFFKEDYEPFGGMQVIFSGDFFQLPPISRDEELNKEKFAFMAPAWVDAKLVVCYLTDQHRQSDKQYNTFLNQIRHRDVSEKSLQMLQESIYNQHKISPTKLYTHNMDVDRINAEHLLELSTDEFLFTAKFKGNERLIEGLKRSVLAPADLKLKIGAKVMFVKNNYEEGFMNGTLGKVIDIKEHEDDDHEYPVVELLSGKKIHVQTDTWAIIDEKGKELASIEQFPLRLAWAITIHKSQGMTLDAAEIDLSKTFERGQGYVALSRLKSLEGLKLMGMNELALEVDDLAFKADQRFQELSVAADDQLPMSELEERHLPFLKSIEGLTDDDVIARYARKREAKKKKLTTYDQTRLLVEEGLGLKQIIQVRALTKGTIVGHLFKIRSSHPDLDLDKFKPSKELLAAIQQAEDVLKKDPKNVTEDGRVRSASIYNFHKAKYEYSDIKHAQIFTS